MINIWCNIAGAITTLYLLQRLGYVTNVGIMWAQLKPGGQNWKRARCTRDGGYKPFQYTYTTRIYACRTGIAARDRRRRRRRSPFSSFNGKMGKRGRRAGELGRASQSMCGYVRTYPSITLYRPPNEQIHDPSRITAPSTHIQPASRPPKGNKLAGAELQKWRNGNEHKKRTRRRCWKIQRELDQWYHGRQYRRRRMKSRQLKGEKLRMAISRLRKTHLSRVLP